MERKSLLWRAARGEADGIFFCRVVPHRQHEYVSQASERHWRNSISRCPFLCLSNHPVASSWFRPRYPVTRLLHPTTRLVLIRAPDGPLSHPISNPIRQILDRRRTKGDIITPLYPLMKSPAHPSSLLPLVPACVGVFFPPFFLHGTTWLSQLLGDRLRPYVQDVIVGPNFQFAWLADMFGWRRSGKGGRGWGGSDRVQAYARLDLLPGWTRQLEPR